MRCPKLERVIDSCGQFGWIIGAERFGSHKNPTIFKINVIDVSFKPAHREFSPKA